MTEPTLGIVRVIEKLHTWSRGPRFYHRAFSTFVDILVDTFILIFHYSLRLIFGVSKDDPDIAIPWRKKR